MPELPEVEVTRRGLLAGLANLPGARVTAVWCSGLTLRETVSQRRLQRHLMGAQITTLERRAKYLLLRMDTDAVLVLHLGMTGRLGLVPTTRPRHKHDHLALCLSSNLGGNSGADLGRDQELRFNDTRRFGGVQLWSAKQAAQQEAALFAREGLEPFSEAFSAAVLIRLAARRSVAVKVFLMNSRLVAGIGNIYANEILFAARIDPQTAACRLQEADWQRIVDSSRDILAAAIEAGGSSIADFLNVEGQPGYFQLHFQVYGRGGEACPQCGVSIIKTVLAGRATYACASCQR